MNNYYFKFKSRSEFSYIALLKMYRIYLDVIKYDATVITSENIGSYVFSILKVFISIIHEEREISHNSQL